MYENPNGWWKELGLSKSRANGIISWMHARRNVGLELPDTVRKKAEDLGKRFYKNEEIEEVGGALWHDLILDRNGKRILGQPQKPNSEVQPLEHLSVPPQFDGSNGSNRGDKSECALDVDSDKEAVTLWLKAKATNANTLNAYRREGERFLLWCLLEKHIPLSSAKISECSDYLTWLQMLGRTDEQTWSQRWLQPQTVWLGPKNIPRDSRDWRPFNCALSFSSRKAASTIVRQLFTFLHKTGYLRFNPFDQISSKVQLLPGEGKPKEFADRSLTKEQWEEIEEYLDKQPDDILKARLKVMLLLGKGLGMRASEMLNGYRSPVTDKTRNSSSISSEKAIKKDVFRFLRRRKESSMTILLTGGVLFCSKKRAEIFRFLLLYARAARAPLPKGSPVQAFT